MAIKYVDIGVDEGIGAKDGSDEANYMGWNQFAIGGVFQIVSGDEYRIRGIRGPVSVWDGGVSATFRNWTSEPWRLYFSGLLSAVHVQWAILRPNASNGIGQASDVFFMSKGSLQTWNLFASNYSRCSFYSPVEGEFPIFLQEGPTEPWIFEDCLFNWIGGGGPPKGNIYNNTSNATDILFTNCASNYSVLQRSDPPFEAVYISDTPVVNPSSTVAFGQTFGPAPAWDSPTLSDFNVLAGYGVGLSWATQDLSAPGWYPGSPFLYGSTSSSAQFKAAINEAGTIYFETVLASSPNPDSTQVKLGLDGGDSSALVSGSSSVLSGQLATFSVTGLNPGTYNSWFVAEDGSGNLQTSPAGLRFTIEAPRTIPIYAARRTLVGNTLGDRFY